MILFFLLFFNHIVHFTILFYFYKNNKISLLVRETLFLFNGLQL